MVRAEGGWVFLSTYALELYDKAQVEKMRTVRVILAPGFGHTIPLVPYPS